MQGRTGQMPEPRSFAFSLSQVEHGWSWRVFDEDGTLVARGENPSEDAARAAVERMLEREDRREAAA